MSTDSSAATISAAVVAPSVLPSSTRQRIFLYLGVLIVLLTFGSPNGGLIDIPISFFLKNRLHLQAHEVAEFRLVAAIPLYLSCVFGFIRDMWNPLGMRDRGFMLLFGTITAGFYVFFAFTPITYLTLLVAVVLLTTSFLFVASAQSGLTSMIGQQHVMTGQISAVWNVFAMIPSIVALLIGGALSGCSKTETTIRLPASYFSSVPRSWPRSPFTPCGDPKAFLTMFIPNKGPSHIR